MKILIADSLHADGIAIFQKEGFALEVYKSISPQDLAQALGGVEGLVIRSATKVTRDLLSHADKLKVVGRAGAGLDNVDIPACTARSVAVMNTPGQNSNAAAELALAYIFALSRHLCKADASMKAGRWDKKILQGQEVKGKTLGIVGIGNIGRILAELAGGVKMRVIGADPFLSAEQIRERGVEPAGFADILAQADYISVHAPRSKETVNLFNAETLSRMKKSAYLINCARGGIVDEQALAEAVEKGIIAGAALDVYAEEPLSPSSPLLRLENIACTPHLGADTSESQVNVAAAVARQMSEFLKTGHNQFVVNL
ncbi:MAG: hydroxyacid dehydrogenase [Desulfarculales bacterium]|nr:hydroxyacid dehydrogenase [Desulfarculales bacterium]